MSYWETHSVKDALKLATASAEGSTEASDKSSEPASVTATDELGNTITLSGPEVDSNVRTVIDNVKRTDRMIKARERTERVRRLVPPELFTREDGTFNQAGYDKELKDAINSNTDEPTLIRIYSDALNDLDIKRGFTVPKLDKNSLPSYTSMSHSAFSNNAIITGRNNGDIDQTRRRPFATTRTKFLGRYE